MRNYALYLDESGDFNDTNQNRLHPEDLSLVGGVLIDLSVISENQIIEMFPHRVHCSEKGFNNAYFEKMEKLKDKGQKIIIFENTERLKIISANRTYINILSEGLVKLFRDLAYENPDGVNVKVIIAQRNAELKEYATRLEEQLILGFGKEKIKGCKYELVLSDAKKDQRLYIADIVCYTYLTSHRLNNKFTHEQQIRAESIFDHALIYSIFEDATVSYIKRLIFDNHLGEAICQICALPHLKKLIRQRDMIIRRLLKMHPVECDQALGQISIQLNKCSQLRQLIEGIALAEHYKQYFLDSLLTHKETEEVASYWQFDTDFHLLTMYDHLGNTHMCEAYLEKCNQNVASLTRSWEHMDYYFSFRLRELNSLMDLFKFEEVIRKSDAFVDLFTKTRDYFRIISNNAGISSDIKSELLGKVEGIRLQALINLIPRKPEMLGEAIKASDNALCEFTRPNDIIRQWNYRSMLMVVSNRANEALECINQVAAVINNKDPNLLNIIQAAYVDPKRPDIYLLLYYSNVAILLLEANHPDAREVSEKLFESPMFKNDYKDANKSGYPWNRILWNVAKYHRLKGCIDAADAYYERALLASRANQDCSTVFSYCVAISAERLIASQSRNREIRKSLENKWREANRALMAHNIPESIRTWFSMDHPDAKLQAESAWK